MLVRRADAVRVIGAALLAKAAGLGHRRVAVVVGRPQSTVRGWLRRFAGRAESVRVLFTGLLHALDATVAAATPTGSVFGDALDVLGLAAAAAARLFGPPTGMGVRRLGKRWSAAGPGPGGPHELTLGSGPGTPTAFGLADHDVITRSWRPDGPQSTAGPQRRTGPGRSR
jgi:hypothetical protein